MSQFFKSPDSIAPAPPGNFPITPFVVGPVGQAGYQTIQSGLDAANAAGGGSVYVLPGTYNENLVLYGNTDIVGNPGNSDSGTAGNTVVIIGTHTPPLTGSFTVANIRLESATDIFNSAAAGSSSLILINIFVAVTNGYIFNLPNWTGAFVSYNVGEGSTNNGVINNTAGALAFLVSATHGAGTANPMITSGFVDMEEVAFNCPWNAQTGTTIACDYVIFTQSVSTLGSSSGAFNWCRFTTGSSTPLTQSSSGTVKMANCIIDTSANPSLAGAGAGILTLNDIVWLNNSNIAGTLTLAGQSLTPNTITAISSGNLTVKSTTGNSGNNAGFIEMILNGQTVYVPYFSNIAP